MTTDTKAVARWDHDSEDMYQYPDGDYVLFTDHERVVGELTSKIFELDRLCDATYVASGADAYNHSCDLIEQLQAERIAKGREPGTEGSLCDGLTWVYGELLESEDEIDSLRTTLAASRAEVEGLKKDAERYRWMRDHAGKDDDLVEIFIDQESYAPGHLDAQVDAAMENNNV